jgi:uncharacterized protein YcsI (UPF0317 family)
MHGGEVRWILNTTAYGAGVTLSSQQVPLGWGCGRTSKKIGILSQASLDLLWGMDPESAFGTICGVGAWLLR